MHDIDTWMFFKYFFKMWVAVWIVSHTFTITMAVFDVGQSVVSRAAGVISSDTAINIDTMITTMETAMESMEIGELVILALETMLVSLCMKVISVFITVILYGRMIEIYLYSSVGAIPFATMSNREWGQIGNNYLRGLFALAFQGFFMMVCVGIYAVLVANIQMSDNIHSALFGVMAYTPKDLTKVKNKIIFNLTKRQLICFGIAAAVGVPFYFLTRGIIGSSNAATGMCLLMLPAFLFAMYEKDGLPLEKVLKNMITVKFIRPPVRKYQMENLYEKKFIMVRKKKGGQKSVKKKKR